MSPFSTLLPFSGSSRRPYQMAFESSESVHIKTARDSLHKLDEPLIDHELKVVRTCVNRQQPFRAESWRSIEYLSQAASFSAGTCTGFR